jgi:phosphoenolpyruvate synthase/pyruvate phosphate dikinase
MSDKRGIFWFDSAGALEPPTLGGKCRNLVALTRVGLPVPPGFAIPAEMFIAFLDATGIREHVKNTLNIGGTPVSEEAATQLAALISNAKVPETSARAILDAYGKLGERIGKVAPRVAVRSSATTEDLESASAAGQQLTLLDIAGGSNLICAVRKCWASIFSHHAILYRQQHGIDAPSNLPAMAVGVQILVPARVAGVMFTANPVTGDSTGIVVEATHGLGETLVSGEVTPDRYLIDKRTGRIIEQHISEKTVELVCTATGSVHRAVPAERRSLPCLSHRDCEQLFELSRAVEAALGPHQDIEWAIDEADRCFLLQARPITVRGRMQRLPEQSSQIPPSRSTLLGEMYRRWSKG